jgi:hypothetical protein
VPIDDRTSTQSYPKPNIANTLADDVGRLRTALDDIDADMAARVTTSDTGTVSTTMLANDAVTYAKIQNVSATDKLLGRSTAGAGDVEEITCTAAGRNLLDDVDAAAQRTTLGLGTLATQSGTFSGTSSGTNTGDQTITLTGDVTGSGTGSFTTAIAAGVIVDADVNASAAIAHSKLANITAGQVLLGNASNVPTATALSGDVTVTSAGVTAISSGVIVNADVNASAAIAGTKISPDFGGQNVVTTGNLQGASINGGPLAGFRNAIINGNFDIWQRGTSFTDAVVYGADRWLNARAGSACTMSRLSWAVGDNTTGSNPKFLCRMAVTSVAGAANFAQLAQRIEGVQTFSGQQVTYSFWAKADANKTIAVDFAQNFGTGGSPSAQVNGIGAAKHNLTTSWQKITGTVSVPGVGGKTLGSDGNDVLVFRIWLDAGSDYNSFTNTLGQQSGTFDIAQVQIEPGPVATTFERRPIGTELALCQRYYQKSFALWSFNGASTSLTVRLSPNMRDVPTASVATAGGATVSVSGGSYTNQDGFRVGSAAASDFSWTASAEL